MNASTRRKDHGLTGPGAGHVSGGSFATHLSGQVGDDLDLTVTSDPDDMTDDEVTDDAIDDTQVWQRIETLMGRRLHLDPDRTTKLPRINHTDTIQKIGRKLVGYTTRTQNLDGLTDHDIAAIAGLDAWDDAPELDDMLRRNLRLPIDAHVIACHDPQDPDTILYLAYGGEFQKTGTLRRPMGGHRARIDNLTSYALAGQWADEFCTQHPEHDPKLVRQLTDQITGREYGGAKYAARFGENPLRPGHVSGVMTALGESLGRGVDPARFAEAVTILTGEGSSSQEKTEALSRVGGWFASRSPDALLADRSDEELHRLMADDSDADPVTRRNARLEVLARAARQAGFAPAPLDPDRVPDREELAHRMKELSTEQIRLLVDQLPARQGARSSSAGVTHPWARITGSTPWDREFLYVDEVEADLDGVSQHARRARLNRDMRGFLLEQYAVENDFVMQRDFARERVGHSATVTEQKKHVPASHVEAARDGRFAQTGDFAHVEIDGDTDLVLMDRVGAEYERLRRVIPKTPVAPVLRWRKTGRHKANGVYSPAERNVAVDPRHPSSMLHEMLHHVDYTADGGGLLSGSDEFRGLLRAAQQRIFDSDDPVVAKKQSYYASPTEVLSRTGELYYHWRGVESSLSKDAGLLAQNPSYAALEPLRDQIMQFWDATLPRLGVELPDGQGS